MGAEKKQADGRRDKKDVGKSSGVAVYVVKVEMYCPGCDGCADKIKSVVKKMDGMKDAKVHKSGNKLTVTVNSKIDAENIKDMLEMKAKEVHISSQPKKDGGGGGDKKAGKDKQKKAGEKHEEPKVEGKKAGKDKQKKAGEKPEEPEVEGKEPEEEKVEKKKRPKEADKKPKGKRVEEPPKEITVVSDIGLDSDRRSFDIRNFFRKSKGGTAVLATTKKLVTVSAKMEVEELISYLDDVAPVKRR